MKAFCSLKGCSSAYNLAIMNIQPLLPYLQGQGAHSFMWPLTLGSRASALCSLSFPPFS